MTTVLSIKNEEEIIGSTIYLFLAHLPFPPHVNVAIISQNNK